MAAGRSSSGGRRTGLLPAPLRLKQASACNSSRRNRRKLMPATPAKPLNSETQPRHPAECRLGLANRELYGFIPWVDSTNARCGASKATTKPWIPARCSHLQSSSPTRGSGGVHRLRGTHRYLLQPAGSSDSRTRARWFCSTGSAGVTSITGIYDPGPCANRFRGGRESGGLRNRGQLQA